MLSRTDTNLSSSTTKMTLQTDQLGLQEVLYNGKFLNSDYKIQ